ncbi:MAG: hypothetical protein AAFU85_16365 [Planctomycetota bacterium]
MRIATVLAAALLLPVFASEGQDLSSEGLRDQVPIQAYYGGLPFYTAFHQHMTTRLSILKASSESPVLTDYLQLTAPQRTIVGTKKITEQWAVTDPVRASLPNENFQIDEFQIDPNFYGFLNPVQRERLDRLAIEFDGSAGLCLTSVAERLQITDETCESIQRKLSDYHESTWLPYFRYEFAARLPADHKYRRCVLVGQYALGVERVVLSALSERERQRLSTWLKKDPPPHEVTEEIRRLAPLPEGLFALAKYYER